LSDAATLEAYLARLPLGPVAREALRRRAL